MCEDQSRSHQPQREPNGDEANSTGDPGSYPFRSRVRGGDAVTSAAPGLLERDRRTARFSGDLDGADRCENTKPCPGVVDPHRGESRRRARDMGGGEGAHRVARSMVRARCVRTCRRTANHGNVSGQRQGCDAEDAGGHAAADRPGAGRRNLAQGLGVRRMVARWIAGAIAASAPNPEPFSSWPDEPRSPMPAPADPFWPA